MKKLIPKHQSPSGPLVLRSDNTRVSRPNLPFQLQYQLKPGEFFYKTKSGKQVVGKSQDAAVQSDNRTEHQKQEGERQKKIAEEKAKQEKIDKGTEQLLSLTKLLMPSTYIGPLFNNNGKSYSENLFREGSGNVIGDLVIDIVSPYALSKVPTLVRGTGNAVVDVAARTGSKTAKAKAVSRRLDENVKKVSSNDPNITEYSSRNQYERETTFMAPWRSKGRRGDTVGDFIDYNYGLYGGKDRLISDLTQKQRDALLRSVIMTDERPGALTDRGHYLIHMDDTGPQPVNQVGLVPKDATNSNSSWISGGTPEIWWNRNSPYYNHRQYRTVQDIPTTYVARQGVLEDLGVKFDGTQGPHISKVIHNPGVVPFEGIDFALRPNYFGGFDRIKFQGSRIEEPLGFGQVQSTPTIQNRPAPTVSPLQTRLTRLQNKKKEGIIPETDQTMVIRDQQSLKEIEDELTKQFMKYGIAEKDARATARYAIENSGEGSHFPIASDEGDLIGGISYMDKTEALRMLRKSGVDKPTEADLQTIMGHEAGHQVEVPFSDKELYTKIGQVLDNEGITAASPNITVEWLDNAFKKYLSEGRLNNGIKDIHEWFLDLPYDKAKQIVENVKRYSMYTGAAYLTNNQIQNK